MRRIHAALLVAALLALATCALTSGCSTDRQYAPAGASRAYVRAMLANDSGTLAELGTVDESVLTEVVSAVEESLTAEVVDVRSEGRHIVGADDVLTLRVVIEAADGSTAEVDVLVDAGRMKVVGVERVMAL